MGLYFRGRLIRKTVAPQGVSAKTAGSPAVAAAAVEKWQRVLAGMKQTGWWDSGGFAAFRSIAEKIAAIEGAGAFRDADGFFRRIFRETNVFEDDLNHLDAGREPDIDYQRRAAVWLTAQVFGPTSGEGPSTPSTGNQVSRNERRSENRFSDAEIEVAHRAAQDTFPHPRLLEIGRKGFEQLMSGLVPSAYAMTRSESRVSVEKLVTDATKLKSGRQQVSVIFGAIPQEEGDSVLQRLVEVMAKSKLQFQVVVPGALPADLERFRGALIRQVQEARKASGTPSTYGVENSVDLRVVSEETAITGFSRQNSENALVYDLREDNGEALRGLEPAVSGSNQGKRMLFVFSDKGMTLTQKSYGLIAAINTLLEQKPEEQKMLHGVQPLSVIFKLAENLQKFAEAARSLASAA